MQWHQVTVYRAHRGAGRNESVLAYMYADNVMEVLERYKRMPGVKRDFGRFFPDITPLSAKAESKLEQRILKEKIIPLDEAKKNWYYPRR